MSKKEEKSLNQMKNEIKTFFKDYRDFSIKTNEIAKDELFKSFKENFKKYLSESEQIKIAEEIKPTSLFEEKPSENEFISRGTTPQLMALMSLNSDPESENESSSSILEEDIEKINDDPIVTLKNSFAIIKQAIKCNDDIQPILNELRNSKNLKLVINFVPMNDDPLLFHMAATFKQNSSSNYKETLSQLLKENILSIKTENIHKQTVFHYLLRKNLDQLIEFLRFIKEQNLQEKIRSICLNDNSFKFTLMTLQKKYRKSVLSSKLKKIYEFCYVE